jgi:insertion element IS1 protein InsB
MVDDGECCFITDAYQLFFKHIPKDRAYYGKGISFPIEQSNADIRHWLVRFIRKSKSTTKSVSMLDSAIALMHSVQNRTSIP